MPVRSTVPNGPIVFPSVPSAGDITMCGWFKNTSNTSYQSIMTWGAGAGSYGGLWADSGVVDLSVYSDLDSDAQFYTANSVDDWVFCAISHDDSAGGAEMTGYGRIESETSLTASTSVGVTNVAGEDMWVGNGVWSEEFVGEWAYIKIWDRLLTADELMLESMQGFPVHFDALWAYLPCFSELDTTDGTTTGDMLDYSGNGNHGPTDTIFLAPDGTANHVPLIPYVIPGDFPLVSISPSFTYTDGDTAGGNSTAPSTGVHGITINSGDLVCIYINSNDDTTSIAHGGGEGTAFSREVDEVPAGETARQALFWKIAGSEPTSYTFSAGNAEWRVVILVFSTTDSIIIDAPANTDTQTGSTQNNILCGAADTEVISDNALSVIFGGKDARQNTEPYTLADNSYIGVVGDAPDQFAAGAYRIYTTGTTFSGDIEITPADGNDTYSDYTYSVHISFVIGVPPGLFMPLNRLRQHNILTSLVR